MQKASKSAFIRKIKRFPAFFAALALAFAAFGCTSGSEPVKREVFAMDTHMNIICYGSRAESAADAAIDEIRRIDSLLSIQSTSGSIYRVNESGSASVGDETAKLVEYALELHNDTGGAFDVTVLPLMKLWGFTSGEYRVPSEAEIAAVLACIGSEKLSLSGEKLDLGDALGIDLGGIAKGYTSDRLTELFRQRGITSACVSLGGNVQCLGAKPDGSAWRCAILHPFNKDSGEYLGIVSVVDKAVITSGAYERNFTDEKTGKLYHHIIDPKTGFPAESGLASVTIVSDSGVLADTLSTACFIMGLEGSIEFWKTSGYDFEMILMSDDGEIHITSGLSESFTSDHDINVIN